MTTYTTTLNRASQITLPKAIQAVLGVNSGDRLIYSYNEKTKSVTVAKEPTLEEQLQALHDSLSEETKANIKKAAKKYANMTIAEMRAAWDKSPEGRKYYKEKYGVEYD